ncbi:MAG: metal-binding protein [Thermosynechococcus sp.]
MPSGRTHDRLTWIGMPLVGFTASALSRDWVWGVVVSSSFGIGGFLLSPDLDTPSLPYYRWGWLRGIWLPYRKAFHHRSFWTHGPLVGTLIRLLYLSLWLGLGLGLGVGVATFTGYLPLVQAWLQRWQGIDWRWGGAIALGLELSALLHITSDWVVSQWRRWHR